MTIFDIDTYDTTFGLIRKIYLCGMPVDTNYILYVNDVYALESKEEEGCQIFDMADRCNVLDFLIKAAVGYGEEGIENRHEYLNFDRVDKVSILSNKQIGVGDGEYNILLEGLFREKEDSSWKNGIMQYKIVSRVDKEN